ncbi:hypothetical protein CL649_03325 [bacterium]|nr:hypothetical protein [bacterium]|tara:strand:+ start:14742 stop:15353 length:612 start_codon:yes stop_codon:yes gene_type:complete
MPERNNRADYLGNWQFITEISPKLKVASNEKEIIALYESGESLIGLQGGDLYESLGGRGLGERESNKGTIGLKLDLGQLVIGQSNYLFASYCKISKPLKPWYTIWVINSPIIGHRRISPKSHPADGLLDIVEFSLSFRQSLKAYKRSTSGDHLPHPHIKTSKKRTYKINERGKRKVVIDGKKISYSNEVSVSVIPHAIAVVLL